MILGPLCRNRSDQLHGNVPREMGGNVFYFRLEVDIFTGDCGRVQRERITVDVERSRYNLKIKKNSLKWKGTITIIRILMGPLKSPSNISTTLLISIIRPIIERQQEGTPVTQLTRRRPPPAHLAEVDRG